MNGMAMFRKVFLYDSSEDFLIIFKSSMDTCRIFKTKKLEKRRKKETGGKVICCRAV